MQSPTLSLLIPCFNAESSIVDLLGKALSQGVSFDEIICYDDGSTDKTSEVIRSFKGVQLLSGRLNKGPSYARNRLAEAAKSDFLHFHDADDSLSLDFVENMLLHLSEDVVAYCDMKTSYNEKTYYSSALQVNDEHGVLLGVIQQMLHLNRTVFPKQAFLKAGGFNEQIDVCEDKLLTIQLALLGLTFKHVDKTLVHRVRQTGSLLDRKSWNEKEMALVVMYEQILQNIPDSLRPYVGEKILNAAWNLHYRGFIKDSQYAVKVARSFGICGWTSSNTFLTFCSRIIGIDNFFAARKTWSSLLNNERLIE
ncbi:MAG: glycosyltransferase [Leptolyngbyaceae cyanobacterium SM1_3_5]|nr:glycosyltransferase [Leptolyngbyaceae cyanobacterium SM1_3_5]